MRLGTAFSSPKTSPDPQVTLTSGGADFAVQAISFSRSIGGAGLPSEIVGGGSSVAGQCTIDFAPPGHETGLAEVAHPWRPRGNLPLPAGALVDAAMGEVQGGTHPVITGGIVAGDSGDHTGALSATVKDSLAGLSTRVSWPYVRSAMPPAQSAPSAYRAELRRVGLTHWAVIDRALRATGNGTGMPDPTPSAPGLSVPLVDTAWPEKGTCFRAQSYADSALQAGFATSQFTRMVGDATMVYAPHGSLVANPAVNVSMRIGGEHSGPFRVDLTWPTGTVFVRVAGTRLIEVYGSGNQSVRHTQQMPAGHDWLHVRVTSGGTVTITTGASGVTPAATTGSISQPSGMTSAVSTISVLAFPGTRAGNLIVSPDTHTAQRAAWTQRTRFYPSSSIPAGLSDMPRQHDVDSLKLLTEITAAACLGFWKDAAGIVKVTAPDYLPSQPSRTEITASLLMDLVWERSMDAVRRRVVLRRSKPVSGSRLVPTITLWQSSGEELARGSERPDIVQTPGNQDWIPCTEMHRVGDPIASTVWGNPDKGQGTLVGGWYPPISDWASTRLVTTLESSQSAGLYVFTSTTVAAQMNPGDTVVLATAPMDNAATTLPTRYRDAATPLLRGWGLCDWIEEDVYSATVGPASAPDLVHNVGPWVQLGIQQLADYLASRLVPTGNDHGLVTLPTVRIRPDWRLEPGDVVTLRDDVATHLTIDVLIGGLTGAQDAATNSMALQGAQVLSGASTLATYADVDAHYAGATYAAVDTAAGGDTYAAFDADPIR